MKKEVTINGLTVEEAVNSALEQLNAKKEDCEIEIIEAPKKTLFGKMKGEAIVKVSTEITLNPAEMKLELAKEYLTSIVSSMGLDGVTLEVNQREDGATIVFKGESIAVLIGHHGETLDALQYLVALNCNQIEGDYYRITLDCGNYREKREVTLKELANRIALKVKKTGKSQLLEPMNPYERRIIHSALQSYTDINTYSEGEEPFRRIVVSLKR
ncbi:MAG: RNA-binding cell elongation regulator Jag/EloR [Oscillospiraceae bacterium]